MEDALLKRKKKSKFGAPPPGTPHPLLPGGGKEEKRAKMFGAMAEAVLEEAAGGRHRVERGERGGDQEAEVGEEPLLLSVCSIYVCRFIARPLTRGRI